MSLPTPAYDRDGITLYCGDCREMLAELPKDAAIVADPPYGIGFVHSGEGRGTYPGSFPMRNLRPITGDNEPFDPTPFLQWPCVFFGANYFAQRLPESGSWHVWDKRVYSGIKDSFADVEFIWASVKAKSEIIEHLWKGVQQASEKGKPKYHVSQKPIRVVRYLIDRFTATDALILDPFAGSGSTLIAARKSGRRAIGVEIDPRYIDVAIRRLTAAETPLFAPLPDSPRPEPSLFPEQ